MTAEHLSEEDVVDAAEGRATTRAQTHLEACDPCRDQVAQFEELVRSAADAAVPEPSPFYWESLRQNVRRRIEHERFVRRVVTWPALGAAAAVAFALLRPAPPVVAPTTPMTLPSWSSLPGADEDAGLRVMEGLSDEAGDQANDVACRSWTECVVTLSDDEASRFNDALRAEMGGVS